MATVSKRSAKPEHISDLEYAASLLERGERDLEFAARIRAESERISREVYERFGPLDIAVPAIRELRDGDDA